MECTLQVGDEVVCVNLEWPLGVGLFPTVAEALTIGATYTVASLRETPPWLDGSTTIVVRVAEKQLPPDNTIVIWGHPHSWFRRVEKPKRETSIETFRKIDREVFDKPKVLA